MPTFVSYDLVEACGNGLCFECCRSDEVAGDIAVWAGRHRWFSLSVLNIGQ